MNINILYILLFITVVALYTLIFNIFKLFSCVYVCIRYIPVLICCVTGRSVDYIDTVNTVVCGAV